MALSLFGGRSPSIFEPFSIGPNWDVFDWTERFPSQIFPRETALSVGTRVDWKETPEAHVFTADLPGLTKEDIKVQVVDDGILEISGERNKEEKQNTDTFHRVERTYGKFLRRFKLPQNSNVDAVCAKAENGILTVTVPKVPEHEPNTRSITIS